MSQSLIVTLHVSSTLDKFQFSTLVQNLVDYVAVIELTEYISGGAD